MSVWSQSARTGPSCGRPASWRMSTRASNISTARTNNEHRVEFKQDRLSARSRVSYFRRAHQRSAGRQHASEPLVLSTTKPMVEVDGLIPSAPQFGIAVSSRPGLPARPSLLPHTEPSARLPPAVDRISCPYLILTSTAYYLPSLGTRRRVHRMTCRRTEVRRSMLFNSSPSAKVGSRFFEDGSYTGRRSERSALAPAFSGSTEVSWRKARSRRTSTP